MSVIETDITLDKKELEYLLSNHNNKLTIINKEKRISVKVYSNLEPI